MPFAHRVIADQAMLDAIDIELDRFFYDVCRQKEIGMLLRLHILGEFFSTEYVDYWEAKLNKYWWLAIWGYTHRNVTDPIGQSIM